MRYLGGKTRSAKAIVAAILADAQPQTGAFDHEKFWRLMTECANRGAIVYVSEYTVPAHVPAVIIWSKSRSKQMRGGTETRPRAIDKLFRIHPA